jgi:hypothetical protein
MLQFRGRVACADNTQGVGPASDVARWAPDEREEVSRRAPHRGAQGLTLRALLGRRRGGRASKSDTKSGQLPPGHGPWPSTLPASALPSPQPGRGGGGGGGGRVGGGLGRGGRGGACLYPTRPGRAPGTAAGARARAACKLSAWLDAKARARGGRRLPHGGHARRGVGGRRRSQAEGCWGARSAACQDARVRRQANAQRSAALGPLERSGRARPEPPQSGAGLRRQGARSGRRARLGCAGMSRGLGPLAAAARVEPGGAGQLRGQCACSVLRAHGAGLGGEPVCARCGSGGAPPCL